MKRMICVKKLFLFGVALATVGLSAAETLPRWSGFNLLSMFIYNKNVVPEFPEEDFQIVRDLGFNFVRLPLDYRYWIVDGDWTKIDAAKLAPIDRAIRLGQHYGVHVQLCFHRAPGYCVNDGGSEPAQLFADERAVDVCRQHWAFFARRYRGIPNAQLSFNLVNEPPHVDAAVYTRVAHRLAAAIWAEDSARLVVSDGCDGGALPVPTLDNRLVQSLHVYRPHPLTHYLAPWAGSPSAPPVWPYPCDAPAGLLAGPAKAAMRAPFVLENIPADTKIRLRLERVSGRVTLRAAADGQVCCEKTLEPKEGAPGWRNVRYYPAWKLSQGTYTNEIVFTLTQSAGPLTLELVEGDWAELTSVTLADGAGNVACLPIAYRWQKPTNAHQVFHGWQAATPFTAKNALPRRYADDGREWLYRNLYQRWDALAATGRPVMMGELGVFHTVPHALALKYLEDNLRLAHERQMGIVLWNLRGPFGILDSNRSDVTYENYRGHKLDRKILDVLQRYQLPLVSLVKPDEILVDGRAARERVTVDDAGRVLLKGGTASKVVLRWHARMGRGIRLFGGDWERTYGKSGWRRLDACGADGRKGMAWYFLAEDGSRCDGYGVKVQPNAFAAWRVQPDGVALSLDVRAGSCPVELGTRTLELCQLVSRRGVAGETPFAAGRAFCRMMCEKPRLPKQAVFGYNDWYCAYGKNTATNFLADGAALLAAMNEQGGAATKPYFIVDDGWQNTLWRGGDAARGGPWENSNAAWGMPMDEWARRVRAMGARPGVWYRPLAPNAPTCKELSKALPIDPSQPFWKERIRQDMAQFKAWGIEIVKIDFITHDWNVRWENAERDTPLSDGLPAWQDRAHTGAETVRGLYREMREAAGDAMLIIGCNAIDHFAAGLFELQRTGDDTSGRDWKRTRLMGPNTLAMRAMHDGTFYRCDADCVGLAGAGLVPWSANRLWLKLVAHSGTALFTSWKRDLMTDAAVRAALGKAWCVASRPQPVVEPLDWLEHLCPKRWRFADLGTVDLDFDATFTK